MTEESCLPRPCTVIVSQMAVVTNLVELLCRARALDEKGLDGGRVQRRKLGTYVDKEVKYLLNRIMVCGCLISFRPWTCQK